MPLASLLKPLSVAPAKAAARPRLGARVRAFAAALEEMHQSFACTAAAGSMVTARALGRPLKDLYTLSSYLPKDPVVSLPDSLANAGVPVPRETVIALTTFHATLSDAKSTALATEAQNRAGRLDPSAWLAASLRWRKTGADAIAACLAMDNFGRQAGLSLHEGSERILEVLRRIRDGETPCVGSDGMVFVPRFGDRRRDTRKVINAPAWHQVGEMRYPVTVTDISSTGIGVAGCTNVKPGDHLAIELNSNRLLLAIAIWVEGNRLGARLFDPLTSTDVLLRTR